jgi:nickel-dependent lactate racemase
MEVKLAYGRRGLVIDMPDEWSARVIEPVHRPGLAEPASALTAALRSPIGTPPLRELVRRGMRVGVIFSDITRATPNRVLLPGVLDELSSLRPGDITLFNALGTHRRNTAEELRGMIGDLVDHYEVIQNDAFDPGSQLRLGVSSRGHEVWINRALAGCDVKVLTGFIEPHFFAGFSGGGKAIMPGMAGQRTVLGNHDARMIGDPGATWGVTHGNPVWEEITEVARTVGGAFLCNVTLNRDREITGIFAGELEQAHAEGCAFARQTAMAPVERPFDIVVTSNGGYPLDLNLYQAVKGMSAAARVVKSGGAVIVAAECWDGIPEHGNYGALLRSAASPAEILRRVTEPGFLEQDQWQAQIQAQIQAYSEVHVFADGLTDEQICAAHLVPCRDVVQTVSLLRSRFGPSATVCVLPEGPLTIPHLYPVAEAMS